MVFTRSKKALSCFLETGKKSIKKNRWIYFWIFGFGAMRMRRIRIEM